MCILAISLSVENKLDLLTILPLASAASFWEFIQLASKQFRSMLSTNTMETNRNATTQKVELSE